MRILLISTSYPERVADGREAAGSFVADFAIALSRTMPVTVLAPGSQVSEQDLNSGLSIVRFTAPRLPLSNLNPLNPLDGMAILQTLRRGLVSTRHIVATQRIGHIFALWALPSGYWARRMRQTHGIPYSVWALGSDIWSLQRYPLIRSVLRSVLRDAQQRYADGLQLGADVTRLAGKPCDFLPSTRELPVADKTLASAPPYRLSFLGRWHKNKGVDLLLDSLELLDIEDWEKIGLVRICGGGPLDHLVRDRCARLQAAGRPVIVESYLDTNAAGMLLHNTDYLLLPSRIESIPVVYSDAMKSGCPVVAMPVGDLPRLLRNHGTGILSEDVTAGHFADALRQALARNPLEFQSALSQAATEFDLGLITRQLCRRISS